MPVSYHANDPNQECFLTPAPFVSIDKSFDKSGDGQILGVVYTITINGTLVPDRGSPSTHSAATNGFLVDSADKIISGHVHAHSYTDILKKQQLIRKLFSKKNEGGRLDIAAPFTGGATVTCYPRIVSINFPEQAPGNIYVQPYTVVLEADQLTGAGVVDPDDMNAAGHEMISAASENWDFSESQDVVIHHTADGKIDKTFKTYQVSHNISATGKRKFNITTDGADGLEDKKHGRDQLSAAGKGFFNKLETTTTYKCEDLSYSTEATCLAADKKWSPAELETGAAWYQARDFCRKKLVHGLHINGVQNIKTSDGNLTKYGVNLPPTLSEDHGLYGTTATELRAFNYVKAESVGELDGTFSVTETWTLAPQGARVFETMDFSIGGDSSSGKTTVTISGNIQGVGGGDVTDYDFDTPNHDLEDKGATDSINDNDLKMTNAEYHFDKLSPVLYLHAKNMSGISGLAPSPITSMVAKNPIAGIITYNYTFEDRKYYIPDVLSESVSLNDNYPGQIIALQQVIGRKRGPVIQDIGTQGVWKRTLSISCAVDVDSTNFCKDSSGDRTLHTTSAECIAVTGNKWATNANKISDDYSDANAKKPSMVETIVAPDKISQRTAIRNLINAFKPTGLAVYNDTSPSESWDPQTGAWSYNIGWIYELDASYICNEDVDNIAGGDHQYPGTPR
tara:strand:- start:1675 stop:3714 length:2040 start_codon:yes stop_codon:yes gene_type:complete